MFKVNIYQKYLRILCFVIGSLKSTGLVMVLILILRHASFEKSFISDLVLDLFCAASAFTLAWMASREGKSRRFYLIPLAICLVTAVASIILNFNIGIDTAFDFSVILIGLAVYSTLQIRRGDRNWLRIVRQDAEVIDLSISSRDDLFNSYVLGPHLELNMNLTGAVDRFLATAAQPTPLIVYIHSAVEISEPLQDTAREVFASHYEDEERRINQYLEGRYRRVIWLVIISVGALSIWSDFIARWETSVTWQILGNLAAFSLWQVGGTFFERSAAYAELQRYQIARNAEIQFAHTPRRPKPKKINE